MSDIEKYSKEELLKSLFESAKSKLLAKDDLVNLINTAFENGKTGLLKDVAFKAKYLTGLLAIVKKKDPLMDEAYFEKTKAELMTCYEDIKRGIKELIEMESGFLNDIFEEKYFTLSQSSLTNLNWLCSDLAYLKLVFNDIRFK